MLREINAKGVKLPYHTIYILLPTIVSVPLSLRDLYHSCSCNLFSPQSKGGSCTFAVANTAQSGFVLTILLWRA